MAHYIIRFFEKHNKIKGEGFIKVKGFTIDSDDSEIQNINDEKEVKMVVEKSFTFAEQALKHGVKQLTFTIEDYEDRGIWCGEGVVKDNNISITKIKKKTE